VRCCSPSLRPAAFPPPSPPPICGRLCSRLHRYYAAVRVLASSTTASPPRLPVAARPRHGGLGEMRSPRFRHVPFIRNGVSDHGRAVAPRMTVRDMLPSALSTASVFAVLSLSRLNSLLHMIAVYASQPSSQATAQHSLKGGSLLPYPHRSFTGWTAPASPGALITDFPGNSGRGARPLLPRAKTDAGRGAHPSASPWPSVAEALLLSELFGPVTLVSLDLAR
jgi:hypothetical protein